MSKETRNSGFQRKSRRKSPSGAEGSAKPRRSKGIVAPKVIGKPRSPKNRYKNSEQNTPHTQSRGGSGALWIYGRHAAQAALSNPRRTIHDIYVTASAQDALKDVLAIDPRHPQPAVVIPAQIDGLFNGPTSHQGVALRVAPLEWPDISELTDGKETPQCCLLYTSPSPRDGLLSRMPSSA